LEDRWCAFKLSLNDTKLAVVEDEPVEGANFKTDIAFEFEDASESGRPDWRADDEDELFRRDAYNLCKALMSVTSER
jgi:hypothetical protein